MEKNKTTKLKVPRKTIREETTRGTGGAKGKERTGRRTTQKRRGLAKSGPIEIVGGVAVSFCGDSDVTEIKDIADMDLSLLRTAGTEHSINEHRGELVCERFEPPPEVTVNISPTMNVPPNMNVPPTTNVPPVTNVPHTRSAEDILRMLDELMPREWVAIEEANVQDVIPNTPGMAMWEMRDINSEAEQKIEMAFTESIRDVGGGVNGHGGTSSPGAADPDPEVTNQQPNESDGGFDLE